MRLNYYDQVLLRVNDIVDKVSGKIASEFKNTNQFDKEPVSTKDLMRAYDSLRPEDMDYLVAKHGKDALNDLIYSMEKARIHSEFTESNKEANNARPNITS